MDAQEAMRVSQSLHILSDSELIESYKRMRSAGDRDDVAILLFIEACRRNIITRNHKRVPPTS